jgi:putative addiction module component (TIGR02574 family)
LELYSQAMSLPVDQREELANLLFESIPYDDNSSIELSEELEQEVERRIAEHAAGKAKTVGLEEFISAIRTAAKPA